MTYKYGFLIYTFLWMLYFLQGAVLGEGSIWSQSILSILVIWSTILLFKSVKYRFYTSMKWLTILLIGYSIYGIIPVINGTVLKIGFTNQIIQPYEYLKTALVSILPVYAYFYYTKKGVITHKELCRLAIIFLPILIIVYYTNETKMLRLALERGSRAREFTNNVSYSFVFLIPYLYLFKKKYLSMALLVGIMLFLIMSMKRGAIFIGMVLIILYLYRSISSASSSNKIGILLITSILALTAFQFVSKIYNESAYFKQRIDDTLEGSSSGRDTISDSLLDYYFNQTNIFQLIFGSGANATSQHAINVAHNDWLELLVNQGLIGFLILIGFFMALRKDVLYLKKINSVNYFILSSIVILLFLRTFFSMSICDMQPFLTLLLGYILSKINSYKDGNKISANFRNHSCLQR